jgi:hypothetical protein
MPAIHRRPGIASVATLAGIVLTLGLAHLAAPEWSRAAGLDVWNVADARAELDRTLTRGREIEAQNEHMLDQIRGSSGVAARLAAGRLTLAAAVAEAEAVNADRPGWADGLLAAHYAVPTHRQRVARYLIAKVEFRYRADPSGWAPLSARLEAEYRALAG